MNVQSLDSASSLAWAEHLLRASRPYQARFEAAPAHLCSSTHPSRAGDLPD